VDVALSLPGLASQLNTTEIINALMDVEKIPRTLLSAKSDDRKYVISQLQSLNTALQDLFTRAKAAAAPTALAQVSATSSHESVKITPSAGVAPMSTQIVVDRVATAHSVVSAPFATIPGAPPVLTIEKADGVLVEVRPASGSPSDVARALTSAGAGVTASAVAAGTDGDGAPVFRLQLTATETGADFAFRVHLGDPASVTGGTASDLAAQPGAAIVTQGADAEVRLWAGTAAEQTMTSSGNVFTDLFPGIDVAVSAVTPAPVTITVTPDAEGRTKAAAEFVKQLTAALAGIAKGSAATPASTPGQSTTLGVFSGDSTVRALRGALTNAVQYPVDGVSPSTIGISFDRAGVLSFDEDVFTKALAEDPAAVEAIFSGVAARVQDVTAQYSDKYDGLLTARITGQQDEVKRLSEQLGRWDIRLEQRRATLERTYASMETMLSRLQAQSSYLTSQINSMTGSRSDS
jgi:flagellar hook-associated protein 2